MQHACEFKPRTAATKTVGYLKSRIYGNSCSILQAQCSSQHFKEAEISFKRTMHSIIGSWNRILKKWWAVVRTVKPPKNFLNTLLLICCLHSFFCLLGVIMKTMKRFCGGSWPETLLLCCVWVLSGYSCFVSEAKDTLVGLIGDCRCECEFEWLSFPVLTLWYIGNLYRVCSPVCPMTARIGSSLVVTELDKKTDGWMDYFYV